MNKRRFLFNAAIMTANALLLSGIGMLLRVFQSNRIGAEGMGLMQLVLSVYYLATNFAVSGFNLAATRLISEAHARNPNAASAPILRRCLLLSLAFGGASGAILFVSSGFIGYNILGDARCGAVLRILSVGLPFFAVSACLRGYFLAVRNSLLPAIGQIIEQIGGFVTMFLILPQWAIFGTAAGCSAIALGMTVGEIVGNIWICGACLLTLPRGQKQQPPSFRSIFAISAPVACGYDLRAALGTLENMLIPAGLKRSGDSAATALAAYGTVKGMAWPVLFLPSAFLVSLSTLLVPEVAAAYAANRRASVRRLAERVFPICLLFAVFIAGGFFRFGNALGQILYQSAEAGKYIRILCPLVPFLYLDSIVDAMLKGMNEQVYSLKVNLSDSCLRIVWIVLLLPRFGMLGFVLATFFSGLYNASLSIGRVVIKSRMRFDFLRWLLLPIGLVLGGGGAVHALSNGWGLSPVFKLCVQLLLTGLIYVFGLLACGILKKQPTDAVQIGKGVVHYPQKQRHFRKERV